MTPGVLAMISISVASFNGAHVSPRSATFDSGGGSIGRGDGNRLILADPERTISRIHAEIVHAGGGRFAVVNRGGSAIALNGLPIESGQQRQIAPADELQIGGYVLRVGEAVTAIGAVHAPAGAAIPADWDPFATDQSVPHPAEPTAFAPAPRPAGDSALDDLFGLTTPLPADALSAWEETAPRTPTPPTPPPAFVSASMLAPTMKALSTGDGRAAAGAVLSWEIASGESLTRIGMPEVAGAPRPAVASSPRPSPAAAPAPRVAPRAASMAPPAVGPARSPSLSVPEHSPADVEALALAWREGLGARDLPPHAVQLTPALMRLAGRLLREATGGTIDLLSARAALKREIRAEMTMIVERENNPLKFSASVDIALGHLLGAPERGFMPGDHAMHDAFEDLRAHQFATLAGMRAALEGIFSRFDPAILEGRLAQKSVVDSLLPSKRKARMWELFKEMYGELATEASDDFHELFGRAFLEAYDQHLGELARDRP